MIKEKAVACGSFFFNMMRLIPEAVLTERFAEHYDFAIEFINRVNEQYGTRLFLNESALFIAIKSAYDDIERYKLYHLDDPELDKSNSVKRVAYIAKWLAKTRPIQYHSEGDDLTNAIPFLSNAAFSISLARGHISAELGKEFYFSEQKEYELIYDLSYREINGDGLLAVFQIVYDLALSNSPITDLKDRKFS